MGKTSIKNLVSLIMEGIITKDELNRLFPPGEFIFIDDLEKYPELFDNVVSVERGGQETPNYQDEPSFQDEPVRMAAESTELNEDDVKLATLDSSKGKYYDEIVDWVRISIEDITVGKKSTLPPIACIEPNTNELVEGIVIGNIMRVFAQSGMSALKFYNYGITDNGVDKSNLRTHYILYNGTVKEFYLHAVRQKKQGTTPERDVQSKLAAAGEDEKLATVKDASVKRYILFPTINQLFSEHKILDKLDISLIPETWATPVRTEHVSNVEKKHKFGGESSEIDTNFISGRDMVDVDTAMNDVMDLRMSLATGAPPAEGEEEQDREREVSKSIPRQHANYIYAGGNWPAKQRVHDKEFFKRAGEKTDIYKLLKKNIQEGNKRVNVTSVLDIKGNVQGDDYVMTSTFTATLNDRNLKSGAGVELGPLFPAISVQLRRPLPEVNESGEPITSPDNFIPSENPKFFVDQGNLAKPKGVKLTGFFPDLMNNLGNEMVSQINANEVVRVMDELTKMAQKLPAPQNN